MVWPHGKTALQEFLLHLNSQHPLIKFTMEQEKNNTISFLDVQVTRKADGTLAHTVHRKPTHTDRYLHSSSFHHPRFKSAVHNTLVRRAFSTCDQHSLKQELHHINTSLQLNGYKHFNFNQPKPSLSPEERPQFKSTITLPYICHTSHKLQRIFSQAEITIFHTAPNKIQASLQRHKDKQDTQDKAGVYRIPCECGKVYIGETGCNISTRVKEHQAHDRLGHLDKSAIIKHSHEQDHRINWKETKLIAPVQFWNQRRVREAIEIKSHNTVPQDLGFYINDIQPATNSHASPGKHNLNPSRPNVHPSSPT